MAHAAQLEFVELLSKSLEPWFRRRKVLEVGSLDITGSIRGFFPDCDYIGVDVGSGRGVDVICEGQNYDAPAESFDTVISCEAMEHNPHWLETFRNMVRLCRPGGLVIMTCATVGRPEHGTARKAPQSSPLTVGLNWNYYRNLTRKDFERFGDIRQAFSFHRFWTNWNHFDLLFVGLKNGSSSTEEARCLMAAGKIDSWLTKSCSKRVHAYRALAAHTVGDTWFGTMQGAMSALDWLHKPR
jgi:SAM-dependent methyltransferase